MNTNRFFSLPNILKPVLLILTLIVVIIVGASKTGNWFFWLNIIIQLVWVFVVCVFFLMGIESLITCGRSAWPLCETIYSAIFFVVNLINTFLIAHWVGTEDSSGALIGAALIAFVMMVLYALGGVMMFRLYRGFVQSGATQNPPGDVQPGNIGQMHPGV